jgi:hypothetical protein
LGYLLLGGWWGGRNGVNILVSCLVGEEQMVEHTMKLPTPCSPFHSNHITCALATVDPPTSPNFSSPTMVWPIFPKNNRNSQNDQIKKFPKITTNWI